MATYQIEWKPSALREVKRLDRKVIPRIIKTIESLAAKPYPQGVKKLHGTDSTYRVRTGNYRIIYEVFETRVLIQIVRVRHRKDAYRK